MSQEEREEIAELLKLVGHVRTRALEIIAAGDGARKRPLRESTMAAAHALRIALEDVERWAGP